MLTSQVIDSFLKLEQILLSTEDTSKVMDYLLPQTLLQLNTLGYDYHFANLLFIENRNEYELPYLKDPKISDPDTFSTHLKQSFFVDIHTLKVDPNISAALGNWLILFDPKQEIERELLWGKTMATPHIENFIAPNSLYAPHVKTLVISPLIAINKLGGALIFATSREASQINEEEKELVNITTNLLSLAYRIWDSQISLTNVTQEVYKMNSKLHQIDKLKDDFVSIASHELRTPMTAIRSYAWMALHRSDVPLSDKLKRYLERTLVSTERLISLVNDMLNVSRIESGRIEISPQAIDVQNLMDEVLVEIDAKAKEKNLNIQNMKIKLPKVFADSNKVHQVLLNLLGNALKFTPPQGTVTVSYFSDGKQVDISVKDSGVGISKDNLSRLFKKFSRLDNSYIAASSSGGTGLGLYISKSLVDLMKGKIWVISEGEGQGTTFSFSLPVATPGLVQEADKFHYKPEGEARMLEPVSIQAYPNEPL